MTAFPEILKSSDLAEIGITKLKMIFPSSDNRIDVVERS